MKLNSAYIIRDVLGKMILIPYKQTKIGNHPIYLNDTGRLIVEMLGDSASSTDLCNKVAQMYDIDPVSKEYNQILEFIANLINMNVVVKD